MLLRQKLLNFNTFRNYAQLLEYESKEMLRKAGVTVQKFCVLKTANDPITIKAKEYVIKAQIHAGGRSKGVFTNGFKGAVHLLKDASKIQQIASKMIGETLITTQTTPEGEKVGALMIAESVDIIKEVYLCILLDSSYNGPVLMVSPDGGDLESVAKSSPEIIKVFELDIVEGISKDQVSEVVDLMKFEGKARERAVAEILKLWKVFIQYDLIQLEVNPLAQTTGDYIYAIDAKILVDDNARFRQKFMKQSKSDIKYIELDGNIGCLVNGAGLAMATMDLIQMYGGSPANFLDAAGDITQETLSKCFDILSTHKKVEVIFINIFGGMVDCKMIAYSLISAHQHTNFKVPMVVRLQGNNDREAIELLQQSRLPIKLVDNFETAAKIAVKSSPSYKKK